MMHFIGWARERGNFNHKLEWFGGSSHFTNYAQNNINVCPPVGGSLWPGCGAEVPSKISPHEA